jgi:hypothetical protein
VLVEPEALEQRIPIRVQVSFMRQVELALLEAVCQLEQMEPLIQVMVVAGVLAAVLEVPVDQELQSFAILVPSAVLVEQ